MSRRSLRELPTALLTVTAALVLATASLGCREEGPAERLGRNLDESAADLADQVKDGVDDALDDAEDAAREARDRIRKGVDEATR